MYINNMTVRLSVRCPLTCTAACGCAACVDCSGRPGMHGDVLHMLRIMRRRHCHAQDDVLMLCCGSRWSPGHEEDSQNDEDDDRDGDQVQVRGDRVCYCLVHRICGLVVERDVLRCRRALQKQVGKRIVPARKSTGVGMLKVQLTSSSTSSDSATRHHM